MTFVTNEIVPETPTKETHFNDEIYVEETPQKNENENFDQLNTTPTRSVSRSVPKFIILASPSSQISLNNFEATSPEIQPSAFKRHQEGSFCFSGSKYPKTNDKRPISKARVALFQETKNNSINTKPISIVLNTKSFYGSNNNIQIIKSPVVPKPKQYKQTPVRSHTLSSLNNKMSNRSGKRSKKGEINGGVRHNIKPIIKKKKSKSESEKQNLKNKKVENEENCNVTPKNLEENKKPSNSESKKQNLQNKKKENSNSKSKKLEETKKPVKYTIDPTKKFFKTVIVREEECGNDTNDLEEANIQSDSHINKKPRLELDAADLSVSEPVIESVVKQSNVSKILKMLDEDWGDEEFEESNWINQSNSITPKVPDIMKRKDATPIPNEDNSVAKEKTIENDITDKSNKNVNSNGSIEKNNNRFYPLFYKRYSSSIPET